MGLGRGTQRFVNMGIVSIILCAVVLALGVRRVRACSQNIPRTLGAQGDVLEQAPPDVRIQLIPRQSLNPTDQAQDPPRPVTSIAAGSSYVVEVWMSDVNNAGQTYTGLTGAYVNVYYTTAWTNAARLSWDPLFDDLFKEGQIDDPAGRVVNFGGSTAAPYGMEPMWARLGWINMVAAAPSVPQLVDLRAELGLAGIGAWGRTVDPANVEFVAHDFSIAPEPMALLLLAVGLAGACNRRRTMPRGR